jgi:hypothetical protein
MVDVKSDAERVPGVKQDPQEHQSFTWATEDAVKSRRSGKHELRFTTEQVEDIILRSFTYVKSIDVNV